MHVVVEIADEDAHRMHFHVRDTATGGVRAMDKYLERIDDIRRIQSFLIGCARREGVEVVENANVEQAIDSVIALATGLERPRGALGMTQTDEQQAAQRAAEPTPRAPCQCESFARVTEQAALAGARWLGRADKEAAEDAAFSGARLALEQLPVDGRIVIGAPEGAEQLATGTTIGAGGEEVDLALDPLEGRAVVARGGTNAISMIAASPRGAMPSLPEMYMRKMAVGPTARGSVSLERSVGDNIRAIADVVRPDGERHHRDRPRPAAPSRSDRGHPRLRARASS